MVHRNETPGSADVKPKLTVVDVVVAGGPLVMTGAAGAAVSIVTDPVADPTLPAASVALTVNL
jgi:hypothetical protein